MKTVRVRFQPQAWVNDYAVDVDAEGATEFEVPEADAYYDGERMKDDMYCSDNLQQHPNAPEWVRKWQGPFYITLDWGCED